MRWEGSSRTPPFRVETPTPPAARIIDAWLEDEITLAVEFDQPVTIPDGESAVVGLWRVDDAVAGILVPTMLVQTGAATIWVTTFESMTAGTVGYTGGNPGALTTANGFPDSDETSY